MMYFMCIIMVQFAVGNISILGDEDHIQYIASGHFGNNIFYIWS